MSVRRGKRRSTVSPAIKQLCGQIVRGFSPDRIILFGSHALGHAIPDSDVDLLVILPVDCDELEKAAEIRLSIDPPFPVDILVRSPKRLEQRLALGDTFLREIIAGGTVLYEAPHR